jgi:hypothetical protein
LSFPAFPTTYLPHAHPQPYFHHHVDPSTYHQQQIPHSYPPPIHYPFNQSQSSSLNPSKNTVQLNPIINPDVASAVPSNQFQSIYQPSLSKFLMEPIEDLDERLEKHSLQNPLPDLIPIVSNANDLTPYQFHQLCSIHHFLLVFAKSFLQWEGGIPNIRKNV